MDKPCRFPLRSCLAGIALLGAISCVGGADDTARVVRARHETRGATRTPDVPDDRLVLPGLRIGPVESGTGEADLIAALGAERVRSGAAHYAESFCADGAVLFEGTRDALIVLWQDSTRTAPAVARVAREGAGWHTPAGVRIGTTVSELEEIAGAPVTFLGFEWDGSGYGRWSEAVDGREGIVHFRVYPDSASIRRFASNARYGELVGDVELTSAHPLIRGMVVPIVELELHWGVPDSFDCSTIDIT